MALQSFFAQLYAALVARLKEKVPQIRWIDMDLSQLEGYEERPPVAWPCLLIDFTTTTYNQEQQQVQWGDVSIQLRLGFAPFSQSSGTAPQAVQEKALQFWELEMKIYQALQGWCPAGNICQPLTRVSAATERRDDPIRVRSMIFSTAFEDTSASPKYTKVERPDLDLEYLKEV